MRTALALLLLLVATAGAVAAPPPIQVRAEIDALMAGLQASGCEFNRNGSWYRAPEAKAHLLKKLNYLQGRTTIASTEQFIELAASKSSMSGRPYLVRCADSAPVESRVWLMHRLKSLRAPNASSPK
jgi:hypothetical protein